MAKIRPGLIKIQGKFGDKVIVTTSTKKSYMREAVKPGTKKHEPALRKQFLRTGYVNGIASDINKAIHDHSNNFKDKNFYRRMLSKFMREPRNERCLLIRQLQGMEINPRYPLKKLGWSQVDLNVVKDKIVITVNVQTHPQRGFYKANCYFNEILLIYWTGKQKNLKCSRQLSDWIAINDEMPEFDFIFPKPAGATHWMICLRQRLGVDEKLVESFEGEGMQVVETGSFNKEEQKLMRSYISGYIPPWQKKTRKKEESFPRVKAKKVVKRQELRIRIKK